MKILNFMKYYLFNENSIPCPQTNVLIGNTKGGITEAILFAPDFQFQK